MYFLVEARTRRGTRRFIVAGDTGAAAETELRTLLEKGERMMDESGDWLEAREIDPSTIVANGVPVPPVAAVPPQPRPAPDFVIRPPTSYNSGLPAIAKPPRTSWRKASSCMRSSCRTTR